ncbi:MAG: hypothetical protein Q7S59_00020 [Sulfurimonas sp.]|nr:hypothetical protein [Sulfurimonas sp.]
MRLIIISLMTLLITSSLFADGKDLAIKYKVVPPTKAKIQWEKIFANEEKLATLGIKGISSADKDELLKFCVNHAADSDSPTVPGM